MNTKLWFSIFVNPLPVLYHYEITSHHHKISNFPIYRWLTIQPRFLAVWHHQDCHPIICFSTLVVPSCCCAASIHKPATALPYNQAAEMKTSGSSSWCQSRRPQHLYSFRTCHFSSICCTFLLNGVTPCPSTRAKANP